MRVLQHSREHLHALLPAFHLFSSLCGVRDSHGDVYSCLTASECARGMPGSCRGSHASKCYRYVLKNIPGFEGSNSKVLWERPNKWWPLGCPCCAFSKPPPPAGSPLLCATATGVLRAAFPLPVLFRWCYLPKPALKECQCSPFCTKTKSPGGAGPTSGT